MTKESIRAAVEVHLAVAEAIRDMGQVPSGYLYAMLMGYMDIDSYTAIVCNLKEAGLVTEYNYMLKWAGPAKP